MNRIIKKILFAVFVLIFILGLIFVFWFLKYKSIKNENKLTTYPTSQISGIIIPHHDLVSGIRAEFIKNISSEIKEPETVILISPNHFDTGREGIQISDKIWELSDSKLYPDKYIIDKILENNLAVVDNVSFNTEHGIYNVISDIKTNFPDAYIVPIILKKNTPKNKLDLLASNLAENCIRCLVVASVDFSHYQPAILADLHDKLSIRALKNLDYDTLYKKSEVDSPESLYMITKWAELHGTKKFNIFKHTNSGVIVNDKDIETTTHVFGYYSIGDMEIADKSVTFLFGGDVMLGREVAYRFKDDIVDSVRNLGDRVFWGVDVGVVNLEGAINDKPVIPNIGPNNFTFVFSPDVVNVLKYIGVNFVSLANNHSNNNNGRSGTDLTRSILEKAGIKSFGGYYSQDVTSVQTIKGNGLNIVLIGVHTLVEKPDITELIRSYDLDPDNRIIIMPHWGVEYVPKHNKGQEELARSWIDAGADIVIGAHPHVIQDVEVYNNKPIIYSLGNLVFDQYFSRAVQEGLLVGGEFKEDSVSIFVLPIVSKESKPELARGVRKYQILNELYKPWEEYRCEKPEGSVFVFGSGKC